MSDVTAAIDVVTSLADLSAYEELLSSHPFLRSAEYVRSIVDYGLAHGVYSAVLGKIAPEAISVPDTNYRESFFAAGLNPRQRAILELMAAEPWFENKYEARIYAAEALTPFALTLRGLFPRFVGSEFAPAGAARAALFPIAFQDLSALSWPSNCFDCVITNDCLEHVADIPRCLVEMRRVLKPGGVCLSTFPFTFAQSSDVKARLVRGEVQHLAAPEYHPNPLGTGEESLVFEVPGWNILEAARQAGFHSVDMAFVSSLERGITSSEIAGILVLRCYK